MVVATAASNDDSELHHSHHDSSRCTDYHACPFVHYDFFALLGSDLSFAFSCTSELRADVLKFEPLYGDKHVDSDTALLHQHVTRMWWVTLPQVACSGCSSADPVV